MHPVNANGARVMALTASCILTGLSSSAIAEVQELETIVVTASRTAQSVDDALAPVTVITREQIERSQAQDVPELLERAPGLQVTRNGGPGAIASVFIRGASSSQTLVLVDGVRVNSAAAGGATLQYLNPDQIERIEIVRGPHSSLYGADAVGGVIQIFTRKGSGKPSLSMTVGGGSRSTGNYALQYGGQTGNTRFNLGASLYETGGYDFTSNKTGTMADRDAYRNKSLNASVIHRFESDVEIGFNAMNSEGKVETDYLSSSHTYTDFTNSSANVYISVPVNDIWQSRFETGWSRNYGLDYTKVYGGSDENTSKLKVWRNTATWQNDIAWHESQLLTAGLDYYNDRVDNSPTLTDASGKKEDSRDNKAIFVQNQSQFDGHDLQIGLRHDNNEAYGEDTTGNIAWGIDLPSQMRVITSYGTAFRAPTFWDLYYPKILPFYDSNTGDLLYPGYKGNPDVKPEKSENFEIQLKGKASFGSWSISAFQNNIDDLIQSAASSEKDINTPTNVDEARIIGMEAQLDTVIAAWQVNTTLTLLDPEDRKTNKQLVKRAKQMVAVNADRQYGAFSIGGSFRAQSKTYNDAANTQELPGFGTVDVRAGYRFSSSLKGQVKLVNLLDKEYQTTKGYKSEPFGVFASVTYTPDF